MKEDKHTVTMTDREAKLYYLSLCEELIGQIEKDFRRIADKLIDIYPKWRITVGNAKSTYEKYLEVQKLISKTKDEVSKIIKEPRKKNE